MAKFHLALKSKNEDRFWGKQGSEKRWVTARDLQDGWTAILYEDQASAESALGQLVQKDQWCVSMNEKHDVKNFVPYAKEHVSVEIRKVANGNGGNGT